MPEAAAFLDIKHRLSVADSHLASRRLGLSSIARLRRYSVSIRAFRAPHGCRLIEITPRSSLVHVNVCLKLPAAGKASRSRTLNGPTSRIAFAFREFRIPSPAIEYLVRVAAAFAPRRNRLGLKLAANLVRINLSTSGVGLSSPRSRRTSARDLCPVTRCNF